MRTKEPHSLRTLAREQKISHMTVKRQGIFATAIDRICGNINMNPLEFLNQIDNAYPQIPNKYLIEISQKSPAIQKKCFAKILPDCRGAKTTIYYFIGLNE